MGGEPGFAGALLNDWFDQVHVDVLGQTPAAIRTPQQLADFWITRLLGRDLPDAHRQVIIDFMAQGRNPTFPLPQDQLQDRLPSMIQLILMSPAFQAR